MTTTEHKQFKPYDKVLVRDVQDKWQVDFYSYWNAEYKHHHTLSYGDGFTINDKHILPYEGNEYLLGTTDLPDEETNIKNGECLFGTNKGPYSWDMTNWKLFKFDCIDEQHNVFKEERFEFGLNFEYAVRFSDFNPYDMEETKKHILCVRNGKIERYKE